MFKAVFTERWPLKKCIETLSALGQLIYSFLSSQSISSYDSHDDCSSKVVLAKLDKTHLTILWQVLYPAHA